MPHICPRSCSRLATAAVFLSVGVVQLIVGIILLRSKYVYLLAGPDFWTASSNVAVGCLLGVSASVWKNKKRPSKKYVIRRNVLLALLFSGLTINATTLGILLLGKGNTLLSIRLESSGIPSRSSFDTEILAYAYATSVCSPIVCVVISIMAISETIFQSPRNKCLTDVVTPQSSLKERTESFQWVYTPENFNVRKQKANQFLSSESSDESEESQTAVRPKYISTVEDLRNVMHRKSIGKRDSTMSDSNIIVQELDRRRNKYGSGIIDPPYRESSLSRSRDSFMREHMFSQSRSPYSKRKYSQRQSLPDGRLSCASSGYVTMERFNRHENRTQDASPATTDDVFSDYNFSPENLNFSVQSKFKENSNTQPDLDSSVLSHKSHHTKRNLNETAVVHKSPRFFGMEDDQNSEVLRFKGQYEFPVNYKIISQQPVGAPKEKEITSPISSGCFSPDGSDFADSFDLSRTSSWAGDVVPIDIKKPTTAKLLRRLIPVEAPVVPIRGSSVLSTIAKDVGASGDASTETRNINRESNGSLVSFRESIQPKIKDKGTEYPKIEPQNVKKYDLSKVATMTSITEEPNIETCLPSTDHLSTYEGSSASSTGSCANLANKRPVTVAYSEIPRERYQKRESPGKFKSQKITAASCKRLRRIWSSVGSEKDVNILDKVVDEDSLIGLSEEQLIARQTRTRSIRKAVEQRIKEEMVF